jgi:methyl-accepting chemotaxis protein
MTHWKLKSRLLAGFGSLLIVCVCLAVVGWTQMSRMWDKFDLVATNVVPSIQTLSDMQRAVAERRRAELRHFIAGSAAEKIAEEDRIAKVQVNFQTAYDHYLKDLIADDEDRRLLLATGAAMSDYVKQMDEDLPKSRAIAGNLALLGTLQPLIAGEARKMTALVEALNAHVAFNGKLAETLAASGRSAHDQARWLMIGVSLLGLVVGIVMTLLVSRAIVAQIGGEPADAVAAARRIAAGDLTGRVAVSAGGEHSLLGSIRVMQDSLRDIVAEVRTGIEEISQSAAQMDAGSREAAHASEQQNDATASMAAAIEELSTSVSHLAESSAQASEIAGQSSDALDRGAQSVETSVRAMRQISGTVGHTANDVRSLGERSKEITAIVGVIKEIAEQTNLLALNAAIEAARAGEQGRGFAVVADEVRKLAERTTQSTQQITQMVDAIVNGTQTAVDGMAASSRDVESGLATAAVALSSMEQIRGGTQVILSSLHDVASALDEQRGASHQIAKSVERVASMTEENSNAVRGLAQSAENLNAVATRLRPVVARFQV